MSHYSTIRPKLAVCPLCGNNKKVPTTKGLCQHHYWERNRMKSAAKHAAKELAGDVDLQTVIDDLDIVFSQMIRLSYADEHGRVECYTCGVKKHWKQIQCGHFIPRINMYTRFSEDNTKPQCVTCNEQMEGNLKAFAEHLERDRQGTVEMLQANARVVHHYDKDELKSMIGDCSRRVKELLKNIYQ